MSRCLHTGTVYQIAYGYPGMFGGDGQDALYDIFSMFNIDTSASDEYDDDYEVERSELQRLKTILADEDETYQEHAEALARTLEKAQMDKEQFVNVLDRLINDSDQRNECVLISWF